MNKRSRTLDTHAINETGSNNIDAKIVDADKYGRCLNVEESELCSQPTQDAPSTLVSSPPSKKKRMATEEIKRCSITDDDDDTNDILQHSQINQNNLKFITEDKNDRTKAVDQCNKNSESYTSVVTHTIDVDKTTGTNSQVLNPNNILGLEEMRTEMVPTVHSTESDTAIAIYKGVTNSIGRVEETKIIGSTQPTQPSELILASSTVHKPSRKLKAPCKKSKKKGRRDSDLRANSAPSDNRQRTPSSEISVDQMIEQQERELKDIEETKKNVIAFVENFHKTPYYGALFAVFEEIIDELTVEICHEVHRKVKTGQLCLNCCNSTQTILNTERYAPKDTSLSDSRPLNGGNTRSTKHRQHLIHNSEKNNGNSHYNSYKGNFERNETIPMVLCDNGCGRYIAANRYAPHLEKCMGLKFRNRSRRMTNTESNESTTTASTTTTTMMTATNTIANMKRMNISNDSLDTCPRNFRNNNNGDDDNNEADVEEIEDDTFDVFEAENNYQKPKTKKNAPATKESRPRHYQIQALIESLKKKSRTTLEKLLASKCGVISLKTGRMCTKSLKCPQHTDEQRAHIRQVLLSSDSDTSSEIATTRSRTESSNDNQSLQDVMNEQTEANNVNLDKS
jgi:hypothetical protein